MSAYLDRIAAVGKSWAEVTDTAFAINPFADLELKLIIAASARTGSNHLCQQLRGRGLRAGEYFHSRRLRALLERTGERLEDQVAALVRRFAYRGGFAVKGAIDLLAVPYLAGEFPRHLSKWRFVHLRRRNIVRQAISHVLAQHTGAWRSVVAHGDAGAPTYDPRAVLGATQRLIEVNALWEAFFSDAGVAPLRVWYEDLDASPAEVCCAVAGFCGVSAPPVPGKGPPELVRQCSLVNAEWEARLRDEAANAVGLLEGRWRALGPW